MRLRENVKSPPLHEAYITLSGFDDMLIKPGKGIDYPFNAMYDCTKSASDRLTETL
jgi:hypothetical protein